MKSSPLRLFQFTLPLTLILALSAGLAAVFLTTSCERRGGVPLTAKAEGARLTVVRRMFLTDSSRWREPRATEIAALTKLDRDLKAKWRGITGPASAGGEAITVARELTAVRQKLDRLCADLSLLTEKAKAQWDEHEASDWTGFPAKDSDTGYKDPYAYYAALPRNEERHFLAQRATIEDPLWKVLDAARRRRDDLTRDLSVPAKPMSTGQSRAEADAEVQGLKEKIRVAAEQFDAAERETARLQKEWEAKNWEGYVTE